MKGIENETKEQKGRILGMLLGTLGASLLGNMLSGKRIVRAGYCSKLFRSKEGKGIVRAGYRSKDLRLTKNKLIPLHSLTNSEIQKYYQNEPIFNGVYSRDNLPKKIKDRHM